MLKILLVAAGLYLLFALLATVFQARLLFPTFAVGAPDPLPPAARRLTVDAADGARLSGVHVPPRERSSEPLLAVIFPGNAWNAQDAAGLFHEVWPAAHIVAFHYRGYFPSTGRPSARALLADAPVVLAEARRQVPGARTIAVGASIGSGVAASLAATELDGLVLITPFDRLRDVARQHYPWLPVRWLFRHDMDAAAALRGSDVPVALVAAEHDTIIPPERTAALRRQVGRLAFAQVVPGAGHNDIYARAEFGAATDAALAAVLATDAAGEGRRR